MKKNDGGPAFPSDDSHWDAKSRMVLNTRNLGMSLRAYIATKAMTSLLADPSIVSYYDGFADGQQTGGAIPRIAEHACTVADAMIAELEKEEEPDDSVA